ncbi:hypothetical protein [Staphylococcus caeli]
MFIVTMLSLVIAIFKLSHKK